MSPGDPDTRRQKTGVNPPRRTAKLSKTPNNKGGVERVFAAQTAIGNFLRATRTAQKLTQEQVAAMTKESPWQLSRAAISAIERGQNFPGMEAMATKARERMAHVGHGAVLVVSHALDDDGDALRTVSLVHHVFEIGA